LNLSLEVLDECDERNSLRGGSAVDGE